MENRYYYNQMTKAEQSVYDAMLLGFTALTGSIRVPLLQGKIYGDVFFRFKLDNPNIFYVNSCSFRWTQGADHAELLPEYMFDKPRIKEHQKAIEARIEKLLRPARGLSETDKERYIHDFICSNVRYDKLKKPYSHEIIGPLQNGVGVCEGIAKTVKLMCDRLGVECVIVISQADPEAPNGYLHAWNVVKLRGKWYHLDATFDNSLGKYGMQRYDYYNLDDKHIFRDHRPLLYHAPECTDGDNFFYKVNKLSWTKESEVASRVAQAIRKKKTEMLFHWRGGYLTREKLSELIDIIDKIAAEKDRGVLYSVNWSQAVIKLSFTSERKELYIETENADEGSLIE